MKRFLFVFVSVVMVMALAAAAAGPAGATTAAESLVLGSSSTSINNNGVIVVSETNSSWELIGEKLNGKYIGSPLMITDGTMKFNNATDKVTFSGTIDGDAFSIKGDLSDYSLSPNKLYYSWNITFLAGQIATLNNVLTAAGSSFSLVGRYAGSMSIDQNLTYPATGPSDVSLNVSRVSSVPVPSALILFAPGLFGLIGLRRRLKG